MAVQNINLSFSVWIAWRERNDNKYKEEQRDKAVIYPTIQFVVILYTKFKLSIL